MSKKLWILIMTLVLLLTAVLGGCSPGTGSQIEEQNVLSRDSSQKAAESGTLQVFFIDCGQGDAILVKSPADKYMLVDAGTREEGQNICKFPNSQGVQELSVVVGTHPHSDHIGGLAEVINSFPVEKVYLPRITHNTATFEALLKAIKGQNLKISTARQGVKIPLEGLQARFIAPVGENYDDLNNYSAVIRIDHNENSFVLTGDAEELSEKEMLASDDKLAADVLKVGHHGSSSSSSPAFLKAVSPRYAVIMCGAGNDYGHPHRETLAGLESAEVQVYRTDLNGTIIMTSDGHNINVKCSGEKQDSDQPAASVQPEDMVQYIGNQNSLKFHRADCKNLPVEKNRIYFKSREEAQNQGYSPCSKCQP